MNHERINKSSSEIELKVTIPGDIFEKSFNELLKQELKKVNLKGFRKGMVPKEFMGKQFETIILGETFEKVAPYYVNAAVIEEKIQPIAPLSYTDLGELEVGKDVTFTVRITVMPKFKLGDLKKIKVNKDKAEATEKEIQEALERMKESNTSNVKEKEINDKWAKEIADIYKFEKITDLNSLKAEIARLIEAQKKIIIRNNAASQAVKDAIKLSEIEIPQSAIDYEAEQREHAFKHDLERIKISVRDFLKQQDTTLEKLKEMWMNDAKEALQNDVLLKLYAEDRKLMVTEQELVDEINRTKKAALLNAKDKSKLNLEAYDDPHWQEHIRGYMLKQKAYEAFIKEVLGEEEKVEEKKSEAKAKEKGKKTVQQN